MVQQNPQASESYFVSSFISGLKDELKHKVKVLQPRTVFEACRQTKLYELATEIETKKLKYVPRTNSYNTQYTNQKATPIPQKQVTISPNNKQSLVDYRRTHNLCFKCGEKFTPGHQCKTKQLNCMEEEDLARETEEGEEELEEPERRVEGGELEISINALIGNTSHSTFRIQGLIRGRPLNILVDSGSTHSFITPKWARDNVEVK
ncbi:hypothetical protein HRI_001658700 [Hibiscus trionum]|uniref:Uncharacterized protein n=1 Tax=Hibiscus trionum TaxID=183268 RepID=A0A9W7LWP3_HIBTR|nr:hypothetical protein HRI_001658700 [Hibiscus trionum]